MTTQTATQDVTFAAYVLAANLRDTFDASLIDGELSLPLCSIMVAALKPTLNVLADQDALAAPCLDLQTIHDVLVRADDIGLDDGATAGPFLHLLSLAAKSARDALESVQETSSAHL